MEKLNHIAFIMDGNGRWAERRHLPRVEGHIAGLKAMRNIIEACVTMNIKNVSFYTFSLENWKRNDNEIKAIFSLLNKEITNKKIIDWFLKNNVRFVWNGFNDKLSSKLINNLHKIMTLTQHNTGTTVQIMFNYGSQQKIVAAVNHFVTTNKNVTTEDIQQFLDPYYLGPVDLLIRTSGEQRLSNFMLYELSYSELIFNPIFWPDYNPLELKNDIITFQNRTRKFGAVK